METIINIVTIPMPYIWQVRHRKRATIDHLTLLLYFVLYDLVIVSNRLLLEQLLLIYPGTTSVAEVY